MFHAEIVRRDGREVGYIRAASYGCTLGGAVGLAMIESGGEPIDQAWIDAGEWTVQIGDRIVPALGVAAAVLRPGEQADQDVAGVRSSWRSARLLHIVALITPLVTV